ncbi:MAG: cytochrome c oxidase assembly protein [Thermoleophilaceae bacterium]
MTVLVAAGGVLAPLQLVFPAAGALLYYRRCQRLAAQERPVPAWRQVSFGLGLVVIAGAISPPLHTLADELLWAHMAQHLLLADIGALLAVLGLTGPLLQPLLSLRVVDRLRVLAHPGVAFPLWALDLYVWHLPPLYQAALSSDLVHALEHGAFFLFGANVWLALFGPLPKPEWFGNAAKLGYIVGVRLTYALLGNVLLWASTVFYPDYGHSEAARHIGGLRDQGLAGTIMMIEGSILTILLFAWLFMKAAREQEERQQLLEYAEGLGVPLSRERAARAVAAGRGEELRGRLARGIGQTAGGRR